MKRLFALLVSALCASAAFCQVTIVNFNPDVGTSTTTGATSASYSTPYTFAAGGASGSAITATPQATGDLASASFFDGITVSGTYVPGCFCTGAITAYLPTLTMADVFTLSGSAGQLIPWTLTLSVTPQFVSASSSVFDNVITQTFSTGGGGAVLTGTGIQQACFATDVAGCGVAGVAGPNNTPFTLSFSGVVSSGGTLSFSTRTTGDVSFVGGPTATSVVAQFALDPSLRLVVPADVTVVSASGVFPVSAVPEPRGDALLLAGLAAVSGLARSRQRQSTAWRGRRAAHGA